MEEELGINKTNKPSLGREFMEIQPGQFTSTIRNAAKNHKFIKQHAVLINNLILEEFKKQDLTIPNTYLQAMESPQADYWKEAMDKEFSSLIENCTWKLEKKPKNRKELKSKWVFDLKSDIRDIVTRFKARLCAVGSSQIHGIDFEETFSPTVRWESLRLFLSIAASKGATFFPHQMDVDTAFLYGDIDKEIFMKQPEGYGTNPENLSCLLLCRNALEQNN